MEFNPSQIQITPHSISCEMTETHLLENLSDNNNNKCMNSNTLQLFLEKSRLSAAQSHERRLSVLMTKYLDRLQKGSHELHSSSSSSLLLLNNNKRKNIPKEENIEQNKENKDKSHLPLFNVMIRDNNNNNNNSNNYYDDNDLIEIELDVSDEEELPGLKSENISIQSKGVSHTPQSDNVSFDISPEMYTPSSVILTERISKINASVNNSTESKIVLKSNNITKIEEEEEEDNNKIDSYTVSHQENNNNNNNNNNNISSLIVSEENQHEVTRCLMQFFANHLEPTTTTTTTTTLIQSSLSLSPNKTFKQTLEPELEEFLNWQNSKAERHRECLQRGLLQGSTIAKIYAASQPQYIISNFQELNNSIEYKENNNNNINNNRSPLNPNSDPSRFIEWITTEVDCFEDLLIHFTKESREAELWVVNAVSEEVLNHYISEYVVDVILSVK